MLNNKNSGIMKCHNDNNVPLQLIVVLIISTFPISYRK